jgi:hypothetical protein
MENVYGSDIENPGGEPSSGFESGGRRGETAIGRRLIQHLPRSHPLDAYERDWNPGVWQTEWLLESFGAEAYTSVSIEGPTVYISRRDLRDGDPMPVKVWKELDRIRSNFENVRYDKRLARFTVSRAEIPDILSYFGRSYSAVKDKWVLRHLLYRWKSRSEVAERLGVPVSKAEYWCKHHDVRFPWKNERVLNTCYKLLNGSVGEVADYLNCGAESIRTWLDRHGSGESTPNDGLEAGQLERLFVDKRLFMAEIARRLGCSSGTVSYWIDAHDIERPGEGANSVRYMSHKGYPCWFFEQNGAKRRVRVHRLAAVAKYGFDQVAGRVVNHESGVPWDDRLSNLKLLTNEQHSKHHNLSNNE